MGSSFGFTIPFVVVDRITSTMSANSFVHIPQPTPTQLVRMRTSIPLPFLSAPMLPLKNRLLTRSIKKVDDCVILSNGSTDAPLDTRIREQVDMQTREVRERDRNIRKSESYALPFMIQTSNGSYSHTGIPSVRDEIPYPYMSAETENAVGEILLSRDDDDDDDDDDDVDDDNVRSVFSLQSSNIPIDPLEESISTGELMEAKGEEGENNVDGKKDPCAIISDTDADSDQCGLITKPSESKIATRISTTPHHSASSVSSEPYCVSGSVFEGYTERKMTFLLVDGMYLCTVSIILDFFFE